MKGICVSLGFLFVLFALVGCGGGGGGGSSSGGGGVSTGDDLGPSQFTVAQRGAAMDRVAAKYDELGGTPATAMPALAEYMRTQPEFADAEVNDDTVVAHFKDGRPFLFLDNFRSDVGNTIPADLPSAKSVAPIPGKVPALVLQLGIEDTQHHTPFRTQIAEILSKKGYSVTDSSVIEVDALKAAPPMGVFYIHTHGAEVWFRDRFDSREYAIWTNTLVNDENELKYEDDIRNGRLIYTRSKNNPHPDPNYHGLYCITSRFVAAYLSMAPRGVAYINACNSASTMSSLMQQAFRSKGAGLYIGHDGKTTPFGYETAAYFFDRLLGGNIAEKPTPAGRPFKVDEVWAKLQQKKHTGETVNYLTDPVTQASVVKIDYGTTMLAPNIKFLRFFYNDYMGIATDLPVGADDVKVTIDGQEFPYQWQNGLIMVKLNSNTKGDVMLEVNGKVSNKRPITSYKGDVIYEQMLVPGVEGPKLTITYHLHLRCDAYAVRNELDGPLSDQDKSFYAAMDSTASYVFSGSVTGATWSGSGTFPYYDHATAGNTFGSGGLVETSHNRIRLMADFFEPVATISGNGGSIQQVYAPAVGGYEFNDNLPVPGRENVRRGWYLELDDNLNIKPRSYEGYLAGVVAQRVHWSGIQANPPLNPDMEY